MPKSLAEFVNEKAAALTEKDHSSDIKERLKIVMDLFQVSRYRPSSTGTYRADASSSVRVGRSLFSGKRSTGGGGTGRQLGSDGPGQREGEVGNIYHLFEKSDGQPASKSTADPFPLVRWVSSEDGSRTTDDGMDDKAATFIRSHNTLLVNADFRVFTDMIGRLCKEKDVSRGLVLQNAVKDVVHRWYEQALTETVIGVQQLGGSKEWGPAEMQRALSPEALTSAVMQRYHVYIACKRDLGTKFGKLAAAI